MDRGALCGFVLQPRRVELLCLSHISDALCSVLCPCHVVVDGAASVPQPYKGCIVQCHQIPADNGGSELHNVVVLKPHYTSVNLGCVLFAFK